MMIKTPLYLKNIFRYDYYILIALVMEILCTTVWVYPYSLPLKALILLYGLITFLFNLNVNRIILEEESFLLLITCICAFIPALVYFDKYGIRGLLFFLNDIVIFFVIFKRMCSENYDKQKELLLKVARVYVLLSFIVSFISLIYLFGSGPLYYLPEGFLSSVLDSIGVLQSPGDSNGFVYGMSNSYLVGIMSSSHSLGYLAYFSLVFTNILNQYYKSKGVIYFFLRLNFVIQIITEVSSGMRTMYLACAVFFVLTIWGKRIKGGKGTEIIFCVFTVTCIAIVLVFVSFTGKHIQNISNLETREISKQTERIIGEWEEVSEASKEIGNTFDGSIYAYNFVKNSSILRTLDALSTTRIRIWISSVFELAERNFIGRPTNTVEVIIKGEKSNIDFHSAYFRALGIYGGIGALCLFIVLGKIIIKCYRIIMKKIKADKVIFTIAVAILTQFVMLLFGGGISGSLDFQIIILWFFSAIILRNKVN